jgi:hypothetical protein
MGTMTLCSRPRGISRPARERGLAGAGCSSDPDDLAQAVECKAGLEGVRLIPIRSARGLGHWSVLYCSAGMSRFAGNQTIQV